jgi:hypothetical protein
VLLRLSTGNGIIIAGITTGRIIIGKEFRGALNAGGPGGLLSSCDA